MHFTRPAKRLTSCAKSARIRPTAGRLTGNNMRVRRRDVNSGGIRTRLKTGLRLLGRMVSSPFPPVGRVFSAPWWGGLGTICIIALSLSVFIFGQRLQDYRLQEQVDQTMAHLTASAYVGFEPWKTGNETDYWGALILVSNTGPETAHRLRIQLRLGSEGIRPEGEPEVVPSEGNATARVEAFQHAEGRDGGFTTCKILVDRLYPDESVMLSQSFAVDEKPSEQLFSLALEGADADFAVPLIGEAVGTHWDLSVKDTGADPQYSMLSVLMPEILASGQRISFVY